jgi:hypothetical protein
MPKVLAGLALLLACSQTARSQQVGDPTFDTRVNQPAFSRWHPRILFDAAHHDVHRIDATYKAFADLVRNDGCVIETRDQPFDRALLSSYDVLVIAGALGAALDDGARAKDPAFTADEVSAIRAWVDRGGSLLLLTDHDPVSSANANLTRAFGVESLREVIVDSEHRLQNYYPANILATRENGLLREHPLTKGVASVGVFGGQSFKVPKSARIIIGIGPKARAGQASAGDAQMVAATFGRGRVVMTGDMGMLSAQLVTENGVTGPWGMNVAGLDNRRLVLNVVRWLAGTRRPR